MTCLAIKISADRATVVTDCDAFYSVGGQPLIGDVTKCLAFPNLEAAITLRGPYELLMRMWGALMTGTSGFDEVEASFGTLLRGGKFHEQEFSPGYGALQADRAEIVLAGFSPAARRYKGYVYVGPDFTRQEVPCPGIVIAPPDGVPVTYTTTTTDELVQIIRKQSGRMAAGEFETHGVDLDFDDFLAGSGNCLVTELTPGQITQRIVGPNDISRSSG